VAAATDGAAFDHLVVIFLKQTPRGIKATRPVGLWMIREIGDSGQKSNGRPLFLTDGARSSTCQNKELSCR